MDKMVDDNYKTLKEKVYNMTNQEIHEFIYGKPSEMINIDEALERLKAGEKLYDKTNDKVEIDYKGFVLLLSVGARLDNYYFKGDKNG